MVLWMFGLSFCIETVAETGLGEAFVADTDLRESEPALTACGNPEQRKLEGQSDITLFLVVGFREAEFQSRGKAAV